MDSARHVINRVLNPHFSSETASYDVVSTIHETPPATASARSASLHSTTSAGRPDMTRLAVGCVDNSTSAVYNSTSMNKRLLEKLLMLMFVELYTWR